MDDNKIEIGIVLTYATGYNSRQPGFARVIKMTEKSVWVEHLNNIICDSDGYGQNGTVIADLETPGVPDSRAYRKYNSPIRGEYIKMNNAYAYIWRGDPESFYTD